MKHSILAMAVIAGLAGSAVPAAAATTLTFSDIGTCCQGGGDPILSNMTYNSETLTYTSGGYIVSLNTTNPIGNSVGAHIGDGTSVAGTYNWHDGMDNQPGAYVSITQVGGGLFSLLELDFYSDSGLSLSGGLVGPLSLGSGTGNLATLGHASYFSNISSLTIYGAGNQQLDNIVLSTASAVPEPATWALMIVGFGLVGMALRRAKTRVTVGYA